MTGTSGEADDNDDNDTDMCCVSDVKQEGLFRKAGNVDRQRLLCERLNSSEPQLLDEFTVHDCATVLKSFLGEMPEPLLVEKYCTAYRQVAGITAVSMSVEQFVFKGRGDWGEYIDIYIPPKAIL